MAIFSSAHLALRRSLAAAPRAASLGEGLRQASDGYVTRRLLHGQLLPRCFTSDAFGPNKNFPPSGRDFAAEWKPHQNLNEFNFVRQNLRSNTQVNFNNADNGGTMSKTAGGEKPSNLGGRFQFPASRMFSEREQYSQKKRDFIHVLLKKNKTFVTVTDASGNKKTGASAGCLEDRKGRSRLSRYAAEATAEHVGRSARKMGLRSVVMKVKGISFFKKKKKVILGFREGFRGERVRDQSPIMYIHDVTQLPHNGCRLPKQRRV
ncbi:hypothetical protein SEVIR_7G094900v4 [Setaria viridis]|uniref:Ribosomal protein S11 n=2 Tax=Setaria TaxID=4554 RepID=K3Y9G9_SETIT|nr:uncharacterized protein LOC106804446 [Setaria italica]XP_034604388.1 30S ribosomal protein S11-like [Setaria viridis]XP_034604389.1 30S ribosomal protein S11-like [Setaria viridis]RCV33499.1 hypothetical protein SETIT_7G087400v2 [Setaria italica]TKW04222.1 hypothetical protein SEVIR_7G094900v2 [Setaria viridis]TKW04223.1 hypothetical protein SEVIR_7G094900v2 [Setaria viridis]